MSICHKQNEKITNTFDKLKFKKYIICKKITEEETEMVDNI